MWLYVFSYVRIFLYKQSLFRLWVGRLESSQLAVFRHGDSTFWLWKHQSCFHYTLATPVSQRMYLVPYSSSLPPRRERKLTMGANGNASTTNSIPNSWFSITAIVCAVRTYLFPHFWGLFQVQRKTDLCSRSLASRSTISRIFGEPSLQEDFKKFLVSSDVVIMKHHSPHLGRS